MEAPPPKKTRGDVHPLNSLHFFSFSFSPKLWVAKITMAATSSTRRRPLATSRPRTTRLSKPYKRGGAWLPEPHPLLFPTRKTKKKKKKKGNKQKKKNCGPTWKRTIHSSLFAAGIFRSNKVNRRLFVHLYLFYTKGFSREPRPTLPFGRVNQRGGFGRLSPKDRSRSFRLQEACRHCPPSLFLQLQAEI